MPRHHPQSSAMADVLQHSFGFSDEGFSDYLDLRSPNRVPVDDMLDIAEKMDTDAHPLVAYSAGWVLAEAVMRQPRPGRPNDFSSEQRQDALDVAEEYWEKSEKGFNKLKAKATSPSAAKSFHTMGFNVGFALSTLPVIELAADWRSGEKVSPADVQIAYEDTQENLLDMGTTALALYERSVGSLKRKVGSQCEKLFGALSMHNAVTLAYAMPFRRKILAGEAHKADFVTIGRHEPHRDIQVRIPRPGDRANAKWVEKFFIYRRNIAPYGTTVEQNLAAYITQKRGGDISLEEGETLRDIEEQISQRFEPLADRILS
jgi:hypothetical protein